MGKKKFAFFFSLQLLYVLFFKFVNIVCPDQIKKLHVLYKKKLQSLNYATQKKF